MSKTVASGKRPLVDPRLKFVEKKHKYKLGRRELQSVTKWVKTFFTPFEEAELAKIVAANRRRKGEKITASQVKKEWKKIAEEGTAIHKTIEEYIQNKIDILGVENQKALAAINKYHELYRNNPGCLVYPEVRVYSEEAGLAGTIDLLLVKSDGTVVIVDWKTNRKLYDKGFKKNNHPVTGQLEDANLTHYQIQLNTYAYILEQEYGLTVSGMFIMHLKDGGVTEYRVGGLRDLVTEMIRHGKV
jgi:ATP-dependent exoDNAse (exonuclease V) beta subunit